MRILLLFILTLGTICAKSQNFIKTFNFSDSIGETSISVISQVDTNYIYLRNYCLGIGICGSVLKIDQAGIIKWKKEFPWIGNSNENNMLLLGDTLICTSHGLWSEKDKRYNVLLLNKNTGDSINHYNIDYNSILENVVANAGVIKVDTNLLLYGESRMQDDTVSAIIQWVSKSGKIGPFREYRYARNYLNSAHDLQVDNNGNLVFVSTRYRLSGVTNHDLTIITKLSPEGILLDQITGPEYSRKDTRNDENFIVTSDGNYAYINSTTKYSLSPNLVCSDSLGNVLWNYNFNEPLIEAHYIYNLSKTKDGGIIGCGDITDHDGYRSAFIFKLSSKGQLEFFKRYNLITDGDDEIESTTLFDLKETDNGNIVAVGHIKYSESDLYDILVVNVNKYGCINVDSCEDEHIILRTKVDEFIKDHSFKLFPNPVYSKLQIDVSIDGIINLLNIQGSVLTTQKVHKGENIINLEAFKSGVYFLNYIPINGGSKTQKFIKL